MVGEIFQETFSYSRTYTKLFDWLGGGGITMKIWIYLVFLLIYYKISNKMCWYYQQELIICSVGLKFMKPDYYLLIVVFFWSIQSYPNQFQLLQIIQYSQLVKCSRNRQTDRSSLSLPTSQDEGGWFDPRGVTPKETQEEQEKHKQMNVIFYY